MVTAFRHEFESQSSELTWKGWIKNYRQDDSYVISWDDRGSNNDFKGSRRGLS